MKVCVIGSGPSGLTTIKQLLDEEHDVTCFEKNQDIGGIWYRHDGDQDQMKVFDSLILTISIRLMAFSDFMPEPAEHVFYTHRQYFEYLDAYAEHYALRRHIVFRSEVHEIARRDDGRYRVTVEADGTRTEHTFDAVALCTGAFQRPNLDAPDLDKFEGEVVHSSRYRNNERFRGKRCLVVGLAESGADLLREVSDVAAACTLSIRSYSLLLPRGYAGYATDELTQRAHHYEIYKRATNVPYPMLAFFGSDTLSRTVFWAMAKVYGVGMAFAGALSALTSRRPPPLPAGVKLKNKLGEELLPPKMDVATDETKENLEAMLAWNSKAHDGRSTWTPKVIFAKNVTFIQNVANGKILVNYGGVVRIAGKRVHFKDGSFAEFDCIVLCTGFTPDFSRLGKDIAVKDNNVRNLYKHCFHPDHDGRIAFMGFVRPFSGGIPICAEMQARYFALLCSNKIRLPPDLARRIREEKSWEDCFTSYSPRHPESIPSQILYLDSIAKEIGCLMPMRELLKHPRLFVRQWFYVFNQACYRLTGPHAMHESALPQIMRGRIGPLGSPINVLSLTALSMLPHFVHPKHHAGRMEHWVLKQLSRFEPQGVTEDRWVHGLRSQPAAAPDRPERRARRLRPRRAVSTPNTRARKSLDLSTGDPPRSHPERVSTFASLRNDGLSLTTQLWRGGAERIRVRAQIVMLNRAHQMRTLAALAILALALPAQASYQDAA